MLGIAQRVRKAAEYDAIFSGGRAFHGRRLSIRALPSSAGPRFGFMVGIRVSPKATERNRTKRRLRAIVREHAEELTTPADVAVIAHPGSDRMTSAELWEELVVLCKQAKLLS